MNEKAIIGKTQNKALRSGFTTGACATAAAKSALYALIRGEFLNPVTITLPKGQKPSFSLEYKKLNKNSAKAGIIKDAGDDPDVTHGALIIAKISHNKEGAGISFEAGEGVGIISKKGLPLKIGEPAINPAPRQMIKNEIDRLCKKFNIAPDFNVKISVPNGKKLAKYTWNERLGIVGGISILGTSGIVIPYSCSAWISTIHLGIDVAIANNITHIIGSTGDLSEKAAKNELKLSEQAYIDMGDFVGGLLKYARKKPLEKITICGGFGKISKLANGAKDLHSKRSHIDFDFLAKMLADLGANKDLIKKTKMANSANYVLELALKNNLPLGKKIAQIAQKKAQKILKNENIKIDIIIINRLGVIVGKSQ